jgi:hypothetical protein
MSLFATIIVGDANLVFLSVILINLLSLGYIYIYPL